MDLTKQREAILESHRQLEKTRGSGWHPADQGALEREQRGELFLSERPVAMQVEDEIFFIGPCASRVRTALTDFLTSFAAAQEADRELLGYGPQYDRQVVRVIQRLLRQATGDILVPAREWNCIASALEFAGLQTVMTSVVD